MFSQLYSNLEAYLGIIHYKLSKRDKNPLLQLTTGQMNSDPGDKFQSEFGKKKKRKFRRPKFGALELYYIICLYICSILHQKTKIHKRFLRHTKFQNIYLVLLWLCSVPSIETPHSSQ